MTFWTAVCLFYTVYHSFSQFSQYLFSYEQDFSKPVFTNLGMCVSKWFVSEATDDFCFIVDIVGVSMFLLEKFCEKWANFLFVPYYRPQTFSKLVFANISKKILCRLIANICIYVTKRNVSLGLDYG